MKIQKLLLTITVLSITACATSYMVKTKSTKIDVQQVNVLAVRYHRPEYAPSDLDEERVKTAELKCVKAPALWADALNKQKAVIDCVNSIKEAKAVYYYMPAAQPYLELDPEVEENPKCLKSTLAKIPLPREIYYLGKQAGKTDTLDPMECFSSSFSTTTNQVLKTDIDISFLKLKKKIVIPFPLSRPIKNAQDLAMWFTVNTFTILKSDEEADGGLWASPVPEALCRTCFKDDALFDEKLKQTMTPVFWP